VVHIISNCPECGVVEVSLGGTGIASRSCTGLGCTGGACGGRIYMGYLMDVGAALGCGGS
jgi:hypothetical protein